MSNQTHARLWALFISVALMCTSSVALAHLMPANRGTINLVNEKAYMVISLPLATFGAVANGASIQGGSMTHQELKAQEDILRRVVRERLTLSTPEHSAKFDSILLNLPTGYGHDPERGDELMIMASATFAQAPINITFTSTLWMDESKPLKMQMTVTQQGKTIQKEVATLTPGAQEHVFFSTPAYVLGKTVQSGITHLLLGMDHLVFLLLVLIVCGTRPRRVQAMAAFILTTALAMYGAALGLLSPPAQWVELGIAASILVVATLYGLKALDLKWGALWIAGLGLLHGWGFVQVQELGTHLPILKTTGFALGVGLGVCALTACVFVAHALLAPKLSETHKVQFAQGAAFVACMFGLWWCVERVGALMG